MPRSSPLKYANPRHVPLARLVAACAASPMGWGIFDGVRLNDALIYACRDAGGAVAAPAVAATSGRMPALWHAQQVARFMASGWVEPVAVQVDEGPEGGAQVQVIHGLHQAYAASLMGHEYLFAQVSGSAVAADRAFWVGGLDELSDEDIIQVDEGRGVAWVHALDGSTVGRFSPQFGIDVHTTISAQMKGAPQCLACSHDISDPDEVWSEFRSLVQRHYGVVVPHQRPVELSQRERFRA